MSKGFYDKLINILKENEKFVDDNDELIKNEIIDFVLKGDKDLIQLLVKDNQIKEAFFSNIDEYIIFDSNKFIEYIDEKNIFNNSYTQFANNIGLNIDNKSLAEKGDISLVWPFKDCVLEGGMTKEDKSRNEIFFNETLAQDEIDRLFEPKVFTNFRKYYAKRHSKQDKGKIVPDEFFETNEIICEKLKHGDNLIIKGNNLLVLHSLKKRFSGKIKLIYIDPPYNTKTDSFRYNDSFTHSTWLTFMKNRLNVAKKLLSDDGVIFVQCDDNEQAYLKILMDEIFGREQSDCIVWRKSGKGRDGKMKNTTTVRKDHEYIIFAFKEKKQLLKSLEKPNWKNSYPNPDKDPRGNYKAGSISRTEKSSNPNHKNYYTVKSPAGKEFTRQFDVSKEDFEKLNYDNRIYWGKNKSSVPAIKIFEDEERLTNTSSLFLNDGTTTDGKKELEKLFNSDMEFFTPKPELLMRKIIQISTSENDIVLDYHIGSGTTLAAAHKMNRQYIGIEQMDYIESVTVGRMKKVIEGEQGGISKSVNWKGGGSFIYYELMKYNEEAIELINNAENTGELLKIWDLMCEKYFLNYDVDVKKVNDNIDEFKVLNLEEQKKILFEMLNKNQLYVNLSEIDDKSFNVDEETKKLNKQFYNIY